MENGQIMFHTFLEDIEPIIEEIENEFEVKYYNRGLFDSKNIVNYESLLNNSDLGYARSGDWNNLDGYLILPKEAKLKIRKIPQRKGGVKFAVDQLKNHKSIEIKIGGIYRDVDNVNVAGRVATVSDHPFSKSLYKSFATKIKKRFVRIGSFYVSPQAEEKLKKGWRLVTNEKMSKDFDLVLNQKQQ